MVSMFSLLLWWPCPHFKLCFFGNIRPWQRYKVIFFRGFFYGIHPSWVVMDLRLKKSQSVCTGAAPVVAVQASAGVTVPAAVLHLDEVLAGGACWLFLHLTLSSSDASCSCSSPLCRLQYSSCLQQEQSWARSSHPSGPVSRAFMSLLQTSLNQSWGRPWAPVEVDSVSWCSEGMF